MADEPVMSIADAIEDAAASAIETAAETVEALSADLNTIHQDLAAVAGLLTQLLARLPATLDGGRLKVKVGV